MARADNSEFTFVGCAANTRYGGCGSDTLLQGLQAHILQLGEAGAETCVAITLHDQLHCKSWDGGPGLFINLCQPSQ